MLANGDDIRYSVLDDYMDHFAFHPSFVILSLHYETNEFS